VGIRCNSTTEVIRKILRRRPCQNFLPGVLCVTQGHRITYRYVPQGCLWVESSSIDSGPVAVTRNRRHHPTRRPRSSTPSPGSVLRFAVVVTRRLLDTTTSLHLSSNTWQLTFNADKFKIMHIGHSCGTRHCMEEGPTRKEQESVQEESVIITADLKSSTVAAPEVSFCQGTIISNRGHLTVAQRP